MSALSLNNLTVPEKITTLFSNLPELSPSTEAILEEFRGSTFISHKATVTIPKTVRTLPQTVEKLQTAKETKEREKIKNCLKTAGVVALVVLGCAALAAALTTPFFIAALGLAVTFGCIAATDGLFVLAWQLVKDLLEQGSTLAELEKQVNKETALVSNCQEDPSFYRDAAQTLLDQLILKKDGSNDYQKAIDELTQVVAHFDRLIQ